MSADLAQLATKNFFHVPSLMVHKKGCAPIPVFDALKDCDYFIIYFSAHWCPPCRGFTPKLAEFYARHHASKKVEVLFFSLDSSESEALNYFETAHGDWWCLPYTYCTSQSKTWMSAYKFRSIPTALVFKNGELPLLMTSSGRHMIMRDRSANQFPWEGIEAPGLRTSGMRLVLLVLAFVVGYWMLKSLLS